MTSDIVRAQEEIVVQRSSASMSLLITFVSYNLFTNVCFWADQATACYQGCFTAADHLWLIARMPIFILRSACEISRSWNDPQNIPWNVPLAELFL